MAKILKRWQLRISQHEVGSLFIHVRNRTPMESFRYPLCSLLAAARRANITITFFGPLNATAWTFLEEVNAFSSHDCVSRLSGCCWGGPWRREYKFTVANADWLDLARLSKRCVSCVCVKTGKRHRNVPHGEKVSRRIPKQLCKDLAWATLEKYRQTFMT